MWFWNVTVLGRALGAQPWGRHTLLATLPLAQGVSFSITSAQGHTCVWCNWQATERDQDRGNESGFSVCLIEWWKCKAKNYNTVAGNKYIINVERTHAEALYSHNVVNCSHFLISKLHPTFSDVKDKAAHNEISVQNL